MRIALLVIATNKYYRFVEPLYESVKMHFFANEADSCQVEVFVFTDQNTVPSGCNRIYQKHLPWPNITLKRFQMFYSIKEELSSYDYIFYCDADMLFVDAVGKEILTDFCAALHPHYYSSDRSELHYEKNQKSTAYVPLDKGSKYYQACFFGGKSNLFLIMTKTLMENVECDFKNGIIAKVHDESHLNCYLADNPPSLDLNPGYCYPQGESLPFDAKIIGVSKDNAKLRSEKNTIFRNKIVQILMKFWKK